MNFTLARFAPAARQAGFAVLPELEKPWIAGFTVFGGRTIPVARTELDRADRRGERKVRWGIGRDGYRVLPGLYAAGNPGQDSPVFVTANYKMSFDALRSSLAGIDSWVVVLDTKGINVWCAAGKGTFGTDELVARISGLKLGGLVRTRTLVLPQLGAPGVSAPEVMRRTGFRVQWGPVRAADIPAWLAAGRVKSAAMREITFGLRDRMTVAPLEFVHAWPVLPAALALAALSGLPPDRGWFARFLPMATILAGILPVGTLAFPALLPLLPSRSFSVKGAALGATWATAVALAFRMPVLATAGAVLAATPAVAFMAMNFTGSTTFTCQPGALAEVDRGFWPMAASLAAGIAVTAVSRLAGI